MAKVALAYSGGLDTTICIWHLRHVRGMKAITFSANVGQPEFLEPLAERAVELGAAAAHIADLRDRFVREFIFPALRAQAVYESHYYLFSALARPLIIEELIQIARQEGCDAIAHGSRGGNDRVRFEACVKALAPDLSILTPLADLKLETPEAMLEYARANKIPFDDTQAALFNIEQNLWGSNFQVRHLDLWEEPPRDLHRLTVPIEEAPARPADVEIEFDQGTPVAIDGEKPPPIKLVETAAKLAGRNAVGRFDVIEERIHPRKTRELYEAPAAVLLYTAHRALQAAVLEREALRVRDGLGRQYADLVYHGKWFTPLRCALDLFFTELNRAVTGTVRLKLSRGTCVPTGIRSPNSLVGPLKAPS